MLLSVVIAVLCLYPLRDVVYLVAAVAAVGLGCSAIWVVATNRRWRWHAALLTLCAVAGLMAAGHAAGAPRLLVLRVLVGFAGAGLLGALALRAEVQKAVRDRWRDAPGAKHPVLILNPKSGGGKVERFRLVEECARRGIGVLRLDTGDDLKALTRRAVEQGAGRARHDRWGRIAGRSGRGGLGNRYSRRVRPRRYPQPPALDLGVERNDVGGALDAFGAARQGTIDLVTANGRVSVNNVSLGLYGMMVASDEYRNDKLHPAAETIEHHVSQ
jgi:hypothetical protein